MSTPSSPGEDAFEQQFDAAVDRLEQRQGRTILQSEVDRLWEAANREGNPEHIEPDADRDLGTRRDRIDHVNEALAEQPEQPEVIAPLSPDATSKERIAWIDARASGAEVGEPADTEGDE